MGYPAHGLDDDGGKRFRHRGLLCSIVKSGLSHSSARFATACLRCCWRPSYWRRSRLSSASRFLPRQRAVRAVGQLDTLAFERRDGVLGYLPVDQPADACHQGAEVGELVVELPLAVGGLADEQDPRELSGVQVDQGAPPGAARRAGTHASSMQ
jgi:hypothetical protein